MGPEIANSTVFNWFKCSFNYRILSTYKNLTTYKNLANHGKNA